MKRLALLLASIVVLVAAPSAQAANGLVGWWTFDEGAGTVTHDSSGLGDDGTISSPATWTAGYFGAALSFDGSLSRVRIFDSPALEPGSAVSVAGWVNASQSPGDYKYIIAKGAASCLAASYGLYTGPDGGLRFYVSQNKGNSYTLSPDAGSAVWDGGWHFVVGTYDGRSVRLYVDGREVGDGTPMTGAIDYAYPDNDLYIGYYTGCPSSTSSGASTSRRSGTERSARPKSRRPTPVW